MAFGNVFPVLLHLINTSPDDINRSPVVVYLRIVLICGATLHTLIYYIYEDLFLIEFKRFVVCAEDRVIVS